MKTLGVILILLFLSSCAQPRVLQRYSSDDYTNALYFSMLEDPTFDKFQNRAIERVARCYGDIMSAYPNKNQDDVAYECGIDTHLYYEGDVYK